MEEKTPEKSEMNQSGENQNEEVSKIKKINIFLLKNSLKKYYQSQIQISNLQIKKK